MRILTAIGLGAAAAITIPSQAFALTVPDVELDLPDSSYEVTADWGAGEVVTDVSTGAEQPGDDDGGDITPDPKPEPAPEPKPDPDPAACDIDTGQTDADKVVLVDGTGGVNADVFTCEKDGDGYKQVESYKGKVGYSGIAAEGKKREGDGKTPSGTFSLDEGFGTKAKPKQFAGSWTQVGSDHVWIDGDASVEDGYNTLGRKSQGDKGESMNQDPAYRYGQVVDYNRDPVKAGAGSAIFLHVHTGSGKTAGCISLAESELLDVFDWQGETDTDIQIRQ